jgi:hypothetical protein
MSDVPDNVAIASKLTVLAFADGTMSVEASNKCGSLTWRIFFLQ